MNFSFSCRKLSFAKAGSVGYVSINGNQVLLVTVQVHHNQQ